MTTFDVSTEAAREMLDTLADNVSVTVTWGRDERTITTVGVGATREQAVAAARAYAEREGIDDSWGALCVSTPRTILDSLRGTT